jgi:hypothetical protein
VALPTDRELAPSLVEDAVQCLASIPRPVATGGVVEGGSSTSSQERSKTGSSAGQVESEVAGRSRRACAEGGVDESPPALLVVDYIRGVETIVEALVSALDDTARNPAVHARKPFVAGTEADAERAAGHSKAEAGVRDLGKMAREVREPRSDAAAGQPCSLEDVQGTGAVWADGTTEHRFPRALDEAGAGLRSDAGRCGSLRGRIRSRRCARRS